MSNPLSALAYARALIWDRLTVEAPAYREQLHSYIDELDALHQRLACCACEGYGSGLVHGVGGSCAACNGTGLKSPVPA